MAPKNGDRYLITYLEPKKDEKYLTMIIWGVIFMYITLFYVSKYRAHKNGERYLFMYLEPKRDENY